MSKKVDKMTFRKAEKEDFHLKIYQNYCKRDVKR